MKNFLKVVGSSIHSPQFYSTLPKKSFKESLFYFLLLILFLTTIHTLTLIKPLFIESPKVIQGFATNLVNCFPKDLEIKIVNGQATSSAKEPYFISCESEKPLVVIDTKNPYDEKRFEEYKAEAWITKNSVVYKKNSVETRSYSFSEIKDFKLNREILDSYKAKFEPYLKFVGPILLVLAFVGIYLLYNFRLLHLLWIALLIWALCKAFKKDLGYGQSYKIGLYAITLGLIVELVVNLTHQWTHFTGFPFMVTILTLAVVFVNLLQPKNKS